MRVIFGIVGLLVVVVIVGLLAKKQLQPLQAMTGGEAGTAASASVPQSAKALQRKTADDIQKALNAGMQRNGDAETGGEGSR